MEKIKVELTGEAPLLMHSADGMVKEMEKGSIRSTTKKYDIKKDAEAVAYRNKKKQLYIPNRCMWACIIGGASWRKIKGKSAKPIIAGCMKIEETEILVLDKKGKPLKKYEIDLRPVVVQRARIVRARPRIDEWKLRFTIIYNDDRIGDAMIKEVLEESGERVGLLDFRPAKYGNCGTFKITKWEVI